MRHPLLALAILLALAVAPSVVQAQETPAFAACEDAAGFLTNGRGVAYDQLDAPAAIELCQAALADTPGDAFLLAYLGRALAKAERYEEALAALRQSADTGNPAGQTFLGVMYDDGNAVAEDDVEAVRLFRLAAEQGYAPGQGTLGRMFAIGAGVPEDDGEAARWYRLAADQGLATAQRNLGTAYESGLGVARDYVEAVRWYRLAAEQHYALAQNDLGRMYDYGLGVAQDYVEAARFYRLAADQGYAVAQTNLGELYDYGLGVAEDNVEAVRWYRLAAEQGDARGQTNLGYMYEHGVGLAQDYVEAAHWYRLAADQGNARAQTNLGFLYDVGQGVPLDDTEALRWYLLAVAQDYARAQFLMGTMYANGEGVPEDDVEAARWYLLAAEQNYVDAQVYLGNLYYNGEGVELDYLEAARWYRAAAEQENDWGQVNLGYMYEAGLGVVADYAEAVRWYRLAADQGNSRAQVNLGLMYEFGRGVAEDDAEAMRLYRLAAEGGNARANYLIGDLFGDGDGVGADQAEAFRWFLAAAELGYADGQAEVGYRYDLGVGVEEDDAAAARWYQLAADQGRPSAQVNLGILYQNGIGVEQDYLEAVRLYRLAASQGYASGQYHLGRMYENGQGVGWDVVQAARLYMLAAAQDYSSAKFALAGLFVNTLDFELYALDLAEIGRLMVDEAREDEYGYEAEFIRNLCSLDAADMEETEETLVALFQRLAAACTAVAAAGYAPAQFAVGRFYEDGVAREPDLAEAARWYRLAAAGDEPDALLRLARLVAAGTIPPEGRETAVDLFKRAEAAGAPGALAGLAALYETGNGVAADIEVAVRLMIRAAQGYQLADEYVGVDVDAVAAIVAWCSGADAADLQKCQAAALQGYSPAERAMGSRYAEGNGVALDYAEAVRWLQAAANNGNGEAAYDLSLLIAAGWPGVPPDPVLAMDWELYAADQRSLRAQNALGQRYLTGNGVERDPSRAYWLFQSAALSGLPEAQINVAWLYLDGVGVARSLREAESWFRQAAEQGYPNPLAQPFLPTQDARVSQTLFAEVPHFEANPANCQSANAPLNVLLVDGQTPRFPADLEVAQFLESALGQLQLTGLAGDQVASANVTTLSTPSRDEVLAALQGLLDCASPGTTTLVWWSGEVVPFETPTGPALPSRTAPYGEALGWPCHFTSALDRALQCVQGGEVWSDPMILRDHGALLSTGYADGTYVSLYTVSNDPRMPVACSLPDPPMDCSYYASGSGVEGIRDIDLAVFTAAIRAVGGDVVVGIDGDYAASLDIAAIEERLLSPSWTVQHTPGGVVELPPLAPADRIGNSAVFYATSPQQGLAAVIPFGEEGERRALGLVSFAFASALLADPGASVREIFDRMYATMQQERERAGLGPLAPILETSDPNLRLVQARQQSTADIIEILEPDLTRGTLSVDTPTVRLVGRVKLASVDDVALVMVNDQRVELRGNMQFSVELPAVSGLMNVRMLVVTSDLSPRSQVIEFAVNDALAAAATGERYALLIGNEDYQDELHYPDLTNAIDDVEALAEVLTQRYGFTTTLRMPDGTDFELLLRDATGDDIERAFVELSRYLTDQDTLLVYYAGHGIWQPDINFAAWVPVDAQAGFDRSFISAENIQRYLLRLSARSVLVISDSCYAGQLTRNAPDFELIAGEDRRIALAEWWRETSRVFIAAGGNQPVLDGGGDGHSVFARALLTGLAEMDEDIFAAAELYQRFIQVPVSARADQEPRYQPYADAGHVGGDFIFFRQAMLAPIAP